MSKIRGRWTGPERKFQEENPEAAPHPRLPYSPDFVLNGRPVFIDSPFWHGYVSADRFGSLPEFWQKKLFRNVVRDACANSFWGPIGHKKLAAGDPRSMRAAQGDDSWGHGTANPF